MKSLSSFMPYVLSDIGYAPMTYFPDNGTSPKEYGMALRKNQRKARKQKRQNPHKR